jgi:hypothetical protein
VALAQTVRRTTPQPLNEIPAVLSTTHTVWQSKARLVLNVVNASTMWMAIIQIPAVLMMAVHTVMRMLERLVGIVVNASTMRRMIR